MSKRIVAIFTGNRAEYGLQFPILRAVDAHDGLDYRLVVSGAHLDPNFGKTLAEIEADGFTVHEEVKIDLERDTLHATANAIGSGVVSMTASSCVGARSWVSPAQAAPSSLANSRWLSSRAKT